MIQLIHDHFLAFVLQLMSLATHIVYLISEQILTLMLQLLGLSTYAVADLVSFGLDLRHCIIYAFSGPVTDLDGFFLGFERESLFQIGAPITALRLHQPARQLPGPLWQMLHYFQHPYVQLPVPDYLFSFYFSFLVVYLSKLQRNFFDYFCSFLWPIEAGCHICLRDNANDSIIMIDNRDTTQLM